MGCSQQSLLGSSAAPPWAAEGGWHVARRQGCTPRRCIWDRTGDSGTFGLVGVTPGLKMPLPAGSVTQSTGLATAVGAPRIANSPRDRLATAMTCRKRMAFICQNGRTRPPAGGRPPKVGRSMAVDVAAPNAAQGSNWQCPYQPSDHVYGVDAEKAKTGLGLEPAAPRDDAAMP